MHVLTPIELIASEQVDLVVQSSHTQKCSWGRNSTLNRAGQICPDPSGGFIPKQVVQGVCLH